MRRHTSPAIAMATQEPREIQAPLRRPPSIDADGDKGEEVSPAALEVLEKLRVSRSPSGFEIELVEKCLKLCFRVGASPD